MTGKTTRASIARVKVLLTPADQLLSSWRKKIILRITSEQMKFLIEFIRRSIVIISTLFLCGVTYAGGAADMGSKSIDICDKSHVYDEAGNFLLKAKDAAKAGQDSSAWDFLKKGINLIGDAYVSSSVLDDTGTKLVLANAKEEKGVTNRAMNLRMGVLESRLRLLGKKLESCKKK